MLYWSLHWISVFVRQCIHSEGGLHIRLSLPLSVVTILLLNISILDPITYTIKVNGAVEVIRFNPTNSCWETFNLGKYFITQQLGILVVTQRITMWMLPFHVGEQRGVTLLFTIQLSSLLPFKCSCYWSFISVLNHF